MKGRGVMPAEPKRDPRVVMMHLRDDAWYEARHPLHDTAAQREIGRRFAETFHALSAK